MPLGFIGDLLGLNAGEDTIAAAGVNKKVIGRYDRKANNQIDRGTGAAARNIRKAGGAFDALDGGLDLYSDALGLNGADGSTRAMGAFQTAPGYEFQMEQGLDALDRRASSRGALASGNNNLDTLQYATGLADQGYNSWLDRLGGAAMTGAGAEADMYGSLAGLQTGAMDRRLGVTGDVASGKIAANNQIAQGGEANSAGIAGLGGNLFKLGGAAFGYGGF